MNLLFVCRGNVGRSQIAEALFNKYAPSNFVASSAGTKVFDKAGNSVDGETLESREGAKKIIEVLAEVGLDVTKAVRNQITEDMLDASDLVVVLLKEEEVAVGYLLDNKKVRFWPLEDPKEQAIEDVRKTRDQIDGLVKNLIQEFAV